MVRVFFLSIQNGPTTDHLRIKPVRVFKDPFRPQGMLVLCGTYLPNGEPTTTNTRDYALETFEKYSKEQPMYGLEQGKTLVPRKAGSKTASKPFAKFAQGRAAKSESFRKMCITAGNTKYYCPIYEYDIMALITD